MRFIADEEVAYAAARSREVHDLWHVLFGCHTNIFGELALKGLEFVQVRLLGRARVQQQNRVLWHLASSYGCFAPVASIKAGEHQGWRRMCKGVAAAGLLITMSRFASPFAEPKPPANDPQTGLPVAALSVAGAQWRLRPQDRVLLWRSFLPWALRAGARAPDLLTLHYERHFEVAIRKPFASSLQCIRHQHVHVTGPLRYELDLQFQEYRCWSGRERPSL